eukprot:SAG11_NODE_1034_length_6091_cov_6.237984_1_plen_48_part_00
MRVGQGRAGAGRRTNGRTHANMSQRLVAAILHVLNNSKFSTCLSIVF